MSVDEVTPEGGRHSLTPFALDVVPKALLRIGAVLYIGERERERAPQQVGEENWRKIRPRLHVRHALAHVVKWLAGDRTEDHLEHAASRLLMAIEREQEGRALTLESATPTVVAAQDADGRLVGDVGALNPLLMGRTVVPLVRVAVRHPNGAVDVIPLPLEATRG